MRDPMRAKWYLRYNHAYVASCARSGTTCRRMRALIGSTYTDLTFAISGGTLLDPKPCTDVINVTFRKISVSARRSEKANMK